MVKRTSGIVSAEIFDSLSIYVGKGDRPKMITVLNPLTDTSIEVEMFRYFTRGSYRI